jgi:hypothetical protein
MDIVLFLGGSSIVAFLLISWIKQLIEDKVAPRFKGITVLIILLAISALLSTLGYAVNWIPASTWEVIRNIGVSAILIYSILYKAIFKEAFMGKIDDGK